MAVVLHLPGQFALWLLPLLLYGLLRTPTTVMLLAFVSEQPDMLRMQAANGIAQRSSGAVAATVVAAVSLAFGLTSPMIVMAIAFALLACVLVLLSRKMNGKPQLGWRVRGEESARVRVTGPFHERRRAGAYARSFELLRTRRLKASSALNTSILLVTILGNAFFPLGLIGETQATISAWVLTFLVARDLVGAVLAGSLLKPLYMRVGLFGALVATAVLFVLGLLLLAVPGRVLGIVLVSALCQGMGCAIAIGCTNLLAAGGGDASERALRIGSTQYLPALVMLLAPAPLGFVLDIGGIEFVFVAGAVMCAALMSYVLVQSAPRLNADE